MPLTYNEFLKQTNGKGFTEQEKQQLNELAEALAKLGGKCDTVDRLKKTDPDDSFDSADIEYEQFDPNIIVSMLCENVKKLAAIDPGTKNKEQKTLNEMNHRTAQFEFNTAFNDLKSTPVYNSIMDANKLIGDESGSYPLGKNGEKLNELYMLINKAYGMNYDPTQLGADGKNKDNDIIAVNGGEANAIESLKGKMFSQEDKLVMNQFSSCLYLAGMGLIMNQKAQETGIGDKLENGQTCINNIGNPPSKNADEEELKNYQNNVNKMADILNDLSNMDNYKLVKEASFNGQPTFGDNNEKLYAFIDFMNRTYGTNIDKQKFEELDAQYNKEKQAQLNNENDPDDEYIEIDQSKEEVIELVNGDDPSNNKDILSNEEALHSEKLINKFETRNKIAEGLNAKHRTGIGSTSGELKEVKDAYKKYMDFLNGKVDDSTYVERTEKDYLQTLIGKAEKYIELKKKNGWGDTSKADWRPKTKMGTKRYEANLAIIKMASERLKQIEAEEKAKGVLDGDNDLDMGELQGNDNEELIMQDNAPEAKKNGKFNLQEQITKAQQELVDLGDNITEETVKEPLSKIVTCYKITALQSKGKIGDISKEKFDEINQDNTLKDVSFQEMLKRNDPFLLNSKALSPDGKSLYSHYTQTVNKVKEEESIKISNDRTSNNTIGKNGIKLNH